MPSRNLAPSGISARSGISALSVIEVGIPIEAPFTVMCDNQGTVFTVHNPILNPGSKHLDIRYFRVRQHIKAGLTDVMHCRTGDNVADFFTKSLAFPQFDRFRNLLMNSSTSLRQEWSREGNAKRQREAG